MYCIAIGLRGAGHFLIRGLEASPRHIKRDTAAFVIIYPSRNVKAIALSAIIARLNSASLGGTLALYPPLHLSTSRARATMSVTAELHFLTVT